MPVIATARSRRAAQSSPTSTSPRSARWSAGHAVPQVRDPWGVDHADEVEPAGRAQRRTLAGLLMPTEGYCTTWTDRVVLIPEDEQRLTDWMRQHLRLRSGERESREVRCPGVDGIDQRLAPARRAGMSPCPRGCGPRRRPRTLPRPGRCRLAGRSRPRGVAVQTGQSDHRPVPATRVRTSTVPSSVAVGSFQMTPSMGIDGAPVALKVASRTARTSRFTGPAQDYPGRCFRDHRIINTDGREFCRDARPRQ